MLERPANGARRALTLGGRGRSCTVVTPKVTELTRAGGAQPQPQKPSAPDPAARPPMMQAKDV